MAGTTSSSASNAMSEMDRSLKRGSGDIGWEYAELADASNLDRLKCKLCGKLVSGGIYRMKQHIAHIKGNVAPCKKSSDEDKAKCKNAIEDAKSKKKQKSRHEAEVRQEVILEGDEDNEASQGTRRMLHTLGPMDRFASPINSYSSLDESRKMRQQNINDALFKQRTHSVHQYLARWVHEAGIPFHAIDSDSFKRFVEAVGQFDLGYRPPSQYQLREPLLKEEVERTKSSLKKQEEEWALNGCSIMTDALSASFWNGVSLCFKVFTPLVKVLRLVDGDRKPSMGFVYGELLRAKEDIKMAFKDQEAHYRPILDIVDEKARDRLDSPLHFAGYLLNPYYTYANPSIENDNVVMDEFFTFVEVFFPDDIQTQSLVINVELHKYLKKEGGFGRVLAKAGCAQNDDNYNPVLWWNIYGNLVPKLQSMAKRILSLTTSSSGCERNWSAFEGIHTKKMNRLDTTRLNNLVYVQFNAKIINKKRRMKEKNVDVLLACEATMAQGWIVDGGVEDVDSDLTSEVVGEGSGLGVDGSLEPRRSSRIQEIRELHEDDFVSDEEEEDEMTFEFESDEEGVLEGYGGEEFED